jgi:hypothetical protein
VFLSHNGVDVFYVDESGRHNQFVFTYVTIPLLRERTVSKVLRTKRWTFVWEDYLDAYRKFRRALRDTHGIPVRQDLHAFKLVAGRGRYGRRRGILGKRLGCETYRWMLQHLDMFLPPESIVTVVGTSADGFYGLRGPEACLFALFQRMQRQCRDPLRDTNGLTFFDQGHPEYIKAYRKARRHLPTGSILGRWSTGLSQANLKMDRFFKDGNFKDSKLSVFTQAADWVAYAATMYLAGEAGTLLGWQQRGGLGGAYSSIPRSVLNLRATAQRPHPLGIVQIPRAPAGP